MFNKSRICPPKLLMRLYSDEDSAVLTGGNCCMGAGDSVGRTAVLGIGG